jgi:L-fuconolactonase
MEMIDAHQHVWMVSERHYGWIGKDTVLYSDFGPERAAAELRASNVTGSILVQVADDYEDTLYMLNVAARFDFVKGVVGWLPLDRPGEAEAAANLYVKSGTIKGVRALTHDYEDDRWLLRPSVASGIRVVADHKLTLDICCTTPRHLENVSIIAAQFPELRIVIDHLGKPNIAQAQWEPWAGLMTQAAEHPNVYVKLSGLCTVSTKRSWSGSAWQPYINHVIRSFSSRRVMLGSDWPVLLLNGEYGRVWQTQLEAISNLEGDSHADIAFRTASRFYSLDS